MLASDLGLGFWVRGLGLECRGELGVRGVEKPA